MHYHDIRPWQHAHTFGQDKEQIGERRTIIVTVITAVMMVVEIAAGIVFGSMALLADGLHMASHATALGINAMAYIYARRHSRDASFNFGTGKVNTLAGFTGAVLLGFFALFMAYESAKRLIAPVLIAFDQAILIAVIGLVVNGLSVLVLSGKHKKRGSAGEDTGHEHVHHEHAEHHHDHSHAHHHDHNLRSAYLHVLADALTSVLAIVALLSAKYFGLVWMDPLMGILGGVLVFRWSLGLFGATSHILLDKVGPVHIETAVKKAVEADGDSRISDLHIWSVGPGIYCAVLTVVARQRRDAEEYRQRLPLGLGLVHVTVEVDRCASK